MIFLLISRGVPHGSQQKREFDDVVWNYYYMHQTAFSAVLSFRQVAAGQEDENR